MILIDPPSGWKYGFPKEMSPEEYDKIRATSSLKEWCIDNGYPREKADSYDPFIVGISGNLPSKKVVK